MFQLSVNAYLFSKLNLTKHQKDSLISSSFLSCKNQEFQILKCRYTHNFGAVKLPTIAKSCCLSVPWCAVNHHKGYDYGFDVTDEHSFRSFKNVGRLESLFAKESIWSFEIMWSMKYRKLACIATAISRCKVCSAIPLKAKLYHNELTCKFLNSSNEN